MRYGGDHIWAIVTSKRMGHIYVNERQDKKEEGLQKREHIFMELHSQIWHVE